MTTPRRNRTRSILALALAISLGSVATACSDDGAADQDSAGTNPPGTTEAASSTLGGVAPGTITVSATTITGQNGKMLLVFATAAAQQGQLGVACIPITSDAFEVPSTPLTEVPEGNPCAGGTATAVFPEGSYTVTAGIYTPGSQTAEAQASMTIDIVGDGVGSLQFTGAALSAA